MSAPPVRFLKGEACDERELRVLERVEQALRDARVVAGGAQPSEPSLLRRKALCALEDAAARVTKTCGATPQRHDDSHVLETGGRGVGFHVRPLR